MDTLITRNIYDKKGNLLIAEGAIINLNSRKMDVLRKIGVMDDILAVGAPLNEDGEIDFIPPITGADGEENAKINTILHELVVRNKGFNDISMSRAAEEINNIIHNYREKPWYLHLSALANYVDWLYTHSINVALIAGMIGTRIGYNHVQLHELILGAMFHDVGMILVPKTILLKPAALTPAEINIVKQHGELGLAMVAESDLHEASKRVIIEHHEGLDGSGYPHNLSENEISEYAQITAIADSFDSGSSFRPYKEVKPMRTVINEMMVSSRYNHKFVKILNSFITE